MFDKKTQFAILKKNLKKGPDVIKGQKVLHFDNAFHGRTGYTMSLTHTVDPRKYQFFPKFNWPRVDPPIVKFPIEQNLAEIEKREAKTLSRIYSILEKDHEDIAAFIMEPIQGEGGDNFFRKEFFQELRKICENKTNYRNILFKDRKRKIKQSNHKNKNDIDSYI